ncbi:nitronate monooxygenase family protein [Streptomyces sp. CC77]|uniref:NAD(P)H-dependent flavin oxidoreductase n=1 Tax=Streptomyces sp. CC77 TaxID=1906739 RepID=UPI0008DC9031|nr:nitronate monooxygenase [Streptomyces sp. CC77]OII67197.1 2-nitropropane dioxygenase [Streptomyces sp. CC77]
MSAGRLGDLLGTPLPVVQGPFGGGLSSVALTTAVSEAGGLGSYGAHVLAPEEITGLVGELKTHTSRPFAVNLWVPQEDEARPWPDAAELAPHIRRLHPYHEALGLPAATAEGVPPVPDFAAQAEALLAAAPPVVSFVMGLPPAWVRDEARRRGILVIGTATTVDEAVALEHAGVDAVVASGSDAGGHRGAFLRPVRESLVGTFSLVPQVADAVSVPVIAAGGIADGRGMAAALTLGADAVQIGTAFLATRESGASPAHKQALSSPEARTTVLTRLFSGRTARGIVNRFIRDLAPYEDSVPPYPVQSALMQAVRREAGAQGRADLASLWAGQAAALTTGSRSAQDYLTWLMDDFHRHHRRPEADGGGTMAPGS